MLTRTRRVYRYWSVLTSLLIMALVMSACGGEPAAEAPAVQESAAEAPAASEAAAPTDTDGSYKESPMLAARVASGELPPIEERLPLEPYVAGPDDLVVGLDLQIGQHGGTIRLPSDSPNGDPHIYIAMNEPLIWAPGAFEYDMGFQGNVAHSFEVNEDDTVFTIHLREGLKWSDGVPVTTEDVRFSYEDVLMNQEITPAFPTWLRAGNQGSGTPMEIEIVDDYTFRIIFDEPYGSFPAQLAIAGWHSYAEFLRPKHFLTQFHIDYTPLEELRPLMEAEAIDDDQWYNLFNARQTGPNLWKLTNEGGLGHPTLTPWVMVRADSGVFVFERNPYYFKVDAEGNQLPYIDGILSEVVQDRETMFARALMGDFDYIGERSSLKNLPLMAEAEQEGRVKLLLPRMHRTPIDFKLNLTFDDPVWQEVTQDVRFRRALNYAINRPEILRTFYLDQFAILPRTTTDPEFSVEKANQLLDEMGMDQRGADGFRLAPNGDPFSILFELGPLSQDHIPMGELIAEYWKSVGIDTSIRAGDWTLINQRIMANEVQATGLWAHVDIWPSAGWDDYLPIQQWGREWHTWMLTEGESGQEPPQEVKDLFDAHNTFMTARIGSPESDAALEAIYQNYRDNVWVFTPVEESRYPTFFTTRIHNVPTGIDEPFKGIVINYSMEQWYIDE